MSTFRRSFRDGDTEVWLRVRSDADGLRFMVATDAAEIDVALPPEVANALAAALDEAAADRPEHPSGPHPPDDRADAATTTGHAELHLVRNDEGDSSHRPTVDRERAHGRAAEIAHETPLDEALWRLRRLAEVLPETHEVFVLDAPTFRVATRMFAAVEVHDGTPVVRFKADTAVQAELCTEERFVPDVDTGQHGWTNVRADALGDDRFEELVVASYRLVAPDDLVAELDARLAGGGALT